MRTAATLAFVLGFACSPSGVGSPTRDSGRGMDAATGTDTGTDTASSRDATSGMDLGTTDGSEICDNGVDDDGNGLIDEMCTCLESQTQVCWPGTGSRRGVGACRDGIQTCEAFGEFFAWGECRNYRLPSAEIPGNGIDEDCDGSEPGGPVCAPEEFGESCGDGIDDDCDGLLDCADPDCAALETCMESCVPSSEVCDDGRDNDCDGDYDCRDSDCESSSICAPPPPPPPSCTREFPFFAEVACGDGRDNDCDGDVDCDDSDCLRPGTCGCDTREDMCSNGTDDDCDGSSDCADLDCQRCTAGTSRWCDEPTYCHWGTQECGPDGRWGECLETEDRPGSCTGDLYSATCCVEEGGCCQNYPVDDTSLGDCDSIVMCR